MHLLMETRQPSVTSTAAGLDSRPNQTAPTPQHITPEIFDEDVSALWPRLLFEAQQFPTAPVCANCGSEHIEGASFHDDASSGEAWNQYAIICSACGAVEDNFAERNDLLEALEIASTPEGRRVERRHLLALSSHCLFLLERARLAEQQRQDLLTLVSGCLFVKEVRS